MLFLFYSRTG